MKEPTIWVIGSVALLSLVGLLVLKRVFGLFLLSVRVLRLLLIEQLLAALFAVRHSAPIIIVLDDARHVLREASAALTVRVHLSDHCLSLFKRKVCVKQSHPCIPTRTR